jgi:hypothetical protein
MARTVVLGLSVMLIAGIAFLSIRVVLSGGVSDIFGVLRLLLSGLILAVLVFGVLGALTGSKRE